jgi:very-short-patch-repair endonuclease
VHLTGSLPDAELRARLRAGTLQRVLRGVYAEPPAPGPRWQQDRHRLLCRVVAVHLTSPGLSWFSHGTAAVLWGCEPARVPTAVDVTGLLNPHVRSAGRTGVRRHWTSRFSRTEEVWALDGVAVSSLERTVVDCARTLPPGEGLVVADAALRQGVDAAVITAMLAAGSGDRGIRRARAVIAVADGAAESAGESLLRWELLDAGLPVPVLQAPVDTRLGRRWVDLAWPEARVAVEFDGRAKYGDDPSRAADALVAEKRRQDAIEEEGWRVLRVDWRDLSHPEAVTGRIARAWRTAPRRPAPR